MQHKIMEYLKSYKRGTIPLSQLEGLLSGDESYEEFAYIIRDLVDYGILKSIKSHGTNGKSIPLHNTYRIMKANLRQAIHDEIQYYGIKLNSNINLDIYFSLDEHEWEKDLPYIIRIDSYLNRKGLPSSHSTASERSLHLMGDEKWIEEKGGKELLERIELWDKLKIITNPDPLMLSVNPSRFNQSSHIHLVVENKATFYALIGSIDETLFTSLVYGSGWKVAANVHMLARQIGLERDLHGIYYFGDIDAEGISIWNSIHDRYNIELAVPFYKALLKKDYAKGKETQRRNMEAIQRFKEHFSEEEISIIDKLIKEDGYIPQEGLKRVELVRIWRDNPWRFP